MRFPNRPDHPALQRGLSISHGLVGAWLCNDRGGSGLREAVFRNKIGTLNGPTWMSSALGSVLQFTDNTYINTNEASRYQFSGGRFTTVFRIKPGTCGTHHGFLSTLNWADDKGWLLRSEGNGTGYKVVIGSTIYDLSAGVALNANVWMNLAITWVSNGAVTSYYNGAYVGTVAIKPITDSGLNLYIGKEQGPNYGYVGLWESLLIYNRVLAPNEIRTLSRDICLPFRKSRLLYNLTAVVPPGTTAVRLTWTGNSEGEDGFSIERDDDGGGFVEIDAVAAGVETWDDTVDEGHTYTYRVRATSAALGDSEYSNTATVTV